MFAALMVVKTFFGSIFGFIFKDWRITVAVILLVISGFLVHKYNGVKKHLAATELSLKAETENNAVLRNNLAIAAKVNSENAALFAKVQTDQVKTTAAVSKLNNNLRERDKTVADLKASLSNVKEPAAKVSSRISIAVQGIQRLRDEAATEATPAAEVTK
jgi:septal ring factor EnvC (AmiA/AmiB activator)